jgi:DNA-binding transcriptional ArsR family regulator
MQPADMDVVFQALAHPDRRRILDIVKSRPGCCVSDVDAYFAVSRVQVLKHLRVLDRAGLLTSQKEGRRRRLYLNAVPIRMIYDRWTSEYSSLWAGRLTEIKYRVESRAADPPGAAEALRSHGHAPKSGDAGDAGETSGAPPQDHSVGRGRKRSRNRKGKHDG